MRHHVEIGKAKQFLALALFLNALPAGALLQLSELRMVDWHIELIEPGVVTDIAGKGRLSLAG
jgi:hypothetical protein